MRAAKIGMGEVVEQRTREQWARVFEQAPFAVSIVRGPQHVLVSANEMQCRLIGFRPPLDRPLRESFPDFGMQGVHEMLDHVYVTGETKIIREQPIAWDRTGAGVSELGHFDVIYQAIRNQEGEIEDVLSFTVDVSDSVRARSAVAEARDSAEHARERLRAILTAIPTATAVLQGDALAFELVDPAYQALVPKLQVVGQPLRDVFPNSVSDHEAVVRAVMRDGAPIHRPEVREVYDRTGTGEPYEGYFNASIAPRKSPDGAIEAVVASIVEVTEQVAQRERLAAVSRELEQAHAQLEQRIAERTEQLAQANRALLYRVVQEAMTNIARHAHAQRVSVVLERHDGHAIVVIEDDGVGFDASVPAVGRLGLIGMHERVLLARGTLDVESEPGRGTTVIASVPFSADGSGG